jgi:hypothetical protein
LGIGGSVQLGSCEVAREKLRAEVSELWEATRECNKKSRRGEMLGLSDF